MTDLFQIAAVGMQDASQRMDAISLNAANAALPGYRRHVVVGRPFDATLAGSDATGASGTLTAVAPMSQDPAAKAAAPVSSGLVQQVDLQPGSLMTTGRPLDLAIEADDLFFALTDGTQTWLTRAGSFRLNSDGVLVGERGLHVVGTEGDIRLPSGDASVEADGRITQDELTVGAIQLFRPNDRASLVAAPGSLLTASTGLQPAEAGASRVRSGTLEASNTDAASEMIGLMTLARQFESLVRAVQGYDGVLGRAIEKLAEV
jgi:flagellar basal body rod protein FlgG